LNIIQYNEHAILFSNQFSSIKKRSGEFQILEGLLYAVYS